MAEPSLTFPRDTKVLPESVSGFGVPGARMTKSPSGVINTRAGVFAGRSWTETYGMLRTTDPTVRNFLAFVRRAYNRGLPFKIKHLETPGSGEPPNGTGTSGVTINGGSQTGDTISTSGWPVSTSNVVEAGDLLRLGSIDKTFEAYANVDSDGSGNADIKINPFILDSNALSDGDSVTTTDVEVYALLDEEPSIPESTNVFYYDGIQLSFIEQAN